MATHQHPTSDEQVHFNGLRELLASFRPSTTPTKYDEDPDISYYLAYKLPDLAVSIILRLLENGPLRYGCEICRRLCERITVRLAGFGGKLLIDSAAFYTPADFARLRTVLDGPLGCYATCQVLDIAEVADSAFGDHFAVGINRDTPFTRAFAKWRDSLTSMFRAIHSTGAPLEMAERVKQFRREESVEALQSACYALDRIGPDLTDAKLAIISANFLATVRDRYVEYCRWCGAIHSLCSNGQIGKILFHGLPDALTAPFRIPDRCGTSGRQVTAADLTRFDERDHRCPDPRFATKYRLRLTGVARYYNFPGGGCDPAETGDMVVSDIGGSMQLLFAFVEDRYEDIRSIDLVGSGRQLPYATCFDGPFSRIRKPVMYLYQKTAVGDGTVRCTTVGDVHREARVAGVVRVLESPTNPRVQFIINFATTSAERLKTFRWDQINLFHPGNLLPQHRATRSAEFVEYGLTHKLVYDADESVVAGAVTEVLPDGTLSSPIELQIVFNDLITRNVLITRA